VRVAVVSDTHMPRFGRVLPGPLVRALEQERVERILHAGDWTAPFVVELLEAIAPVHGVAGNNDPPELAERLGTVRVLDLDGVLVGITHGHLGSARLATPQRAVAALAHIPGIAAVCFGHSHIPLVRTEPVGGPLLVNPGSPTDRRRQPRFSWALLDVGGGAVSAELRFFDR